MEPTVITMTYKCGHTVNILSPGVSDPAGALKDTGGSTYPKPCWTCDPNAAYLVQVPPETTEALRKAKAGEVTKFE